MTIREILDGVGEVQGDVVIRHWDEFEDKYSFQEDLWMLSTCDSILDREITHVYASSGPTLIFEVE